MEWLLVCFGQEYMMLARSWFQFVRLLVSGRLATTTYFFLVYELPPSSYISYSLECARVCWLFELELIQSYSPILKLELVPFVLFVLSLRSMLRECTWHTLAGSLDTPHRLMPKASSCSRVTAHHFQFSTSCPGTVHCHDGQHDLSPVRLFTCSPDNVCCWDSQDCCYARS